MNISPIGFYLFAGLAIACAMLVVFKKSPVSSAFSLIMVFAAFAGIYANLGAHLVAVIQILVYAGAIMVLFIFVIMLLSADEPSFDMQRSHPAAKVFVGVFCVFMLGIFIWALKKSGDHSALPGRYTLEAIENAGGNTRLISRQMFSKYILPFELTSVLLMAAIVGAIALAKRNIGKEGK